MKKITIKAAADALASTFGVGLILGNKDAFKGIITENDNPTSKAVAEAIGEIYGVPAIALNRNGE